MRAPLLSALFLALASVSTLTIAQTADTVYLGGDIITMNPAQPMVEALAVKDGRILAAGKDAAMKAHFRPTQTRVVDLQGKTLLPGFLDAHSHYVHSLTIPNQVNVFAPPAGPGKDVPSILAQLTRFQAENDLNDGELIQAYGYDDALMPGGRRLNRDDLDRALPDNPVIVGHVSMHGVVMNSAAMRMFNLSAATPTPEGGIIVRKPGTQEPWGLIMETAYLPIFEKLPRPQRSELVRMSQDAQRLYAKNGYTTIHDGATTAIELESMQYAAANDGNILDIVAYPLITEVDKVLKKNPVSSWGQYRQRLKIGGVKITADGSPQARTAFFTEPYLTGGPSGESPWHGEPMFPQGTLNQMVKRVYDMQVPLNLHANGDAAIDAFLAAHEAATDDNPETDRNVTIIHSQFVRPDQLDKFAQYKVQPAMYSLHTFYFADTHIVNRGKEQAQYISPMRDAIDKGLAPTSHTDYVVVPLDPMFLLWAAVNRTSRNGEVIGAEQRITPWEALASITLNVAQQYNEADNKGSLEAGKLADLVVLDRNPLKVDPQDIRNIKIVATIKEGQVVYPEGSNSF